MSRRINPHVIHIVLIPLLSSMTCTKYIERRIVCAWKTISRRTRRRHRASILPEDFVLLTARRRSIRFN